ncbi:MAG: type I-C CRISPR-associated protein Cas8c/Csd1 [Ruminococcus sp.]|nr:type I-C CRISPR-associated protein Cas8c/Csd1 [Ruminococcus sp.]
MLIKALCEYADFLDETGQDMLPEGWGYQYVSYRIMLTPEGDVSNIIDIREVQSQTDKKGKAKTIKTAAKLLLPERTQKTAIDSNTIEHRPLYIFGLELTKDGLEVTSKSEKSHKAFAEHELDFFEGLDSKVCTAYRKFIEKWQPENEKGNALLCDLKNEYKNSYFAFGLTGGAANLEDDEQFKSKYNEHIKCKASEKTDSDDDMLQCSITGEMSAPARIHDKIKFPGGNSTGCVLVGMKEPSFESYGKTQSFNSGISEAAMKKYTSTLNKLLSDKRHRMILGDLVLLFFALKSDDGAECDLFSMMLGETREQQAAKTESGIHDVLKTAFAGSSGDDKAVAELSCDNEVTFYIAGLTANSSRICQKFIYRDKFGAIVGNLKKHQEDLHICNNKRPVYFSDIEKQLISPKSTDTAIPPPLMTSIIMAALNGSKYPVGLLESVIRRVKTDNDEENNNYIKLNDTRAGIIKACLNRKYGREEITVALNEENRDPAYLCGRLFAVLEKIQQESVEGTLNRTITDAYFSSAAGRPSTILPKLMQLSKNHLRKLSEGRAVYFEKLTGEIIGDMENGFPQTLDLDGQGKFIVGFYQQKQAFFQKNTNDRKDG